MSSMHSSLQNADTKTSATLLECSDVHQQAEEGGDYHTQASTNATRTGLPLISACTTSLGSIDTTKATYKLDRAKMPSATYLSSPHSESSLKQDSIQLGRAQPYLRAENVRWNPGLIRHIPWAALLVLVCAICSIVAAVIILEAADGKAVSSWKYAPTVYLAILSTLTNVCLAAAMDRGVILSWWRHVLHGSTVKDLSNLWSYGTNLVPALFALKKAYRLSVHGLAIVKVFLAIVLIDGPLLQRALTIVPLERESAISMQAHIAPQLPQGYTSTLGGRTFQYTPTDSYSTVMREYSQQVKMLSPFNGTCHGNCSAMILAAGLSASNCTESSEPLSYSDQNANTNTEWLSFFASTTLLGDESGVQGLTLNIGGPIIPDDSCTGHFVTTTCYLKSATAKYPVTINSDGISISFQSSANLSHPEIVALSKNIATEPQPGTTLAGLVATSDERFNASFSWLIDHIYGWQFVDANLFATQYLGSYRQSTGCPGSYRNPKNDILAAYNEIMFRLSLLAAQTDVNLTQYPLDKGLSLSQAVDVSSNDTVNIYEVVRWAMAVAIAVMVAGVAAVLWTLWGWWEIGIEVSLDPIVTAKAFSAPIFAAYPSNGSLKDGTRTGSPGFKFRTSAFWRRLRSRTAVHQTTLVQSDQQRTIRLRYGAIDFEQEHNGRQAPQSSATTGAEGPAKGQQLREGWAATTGRDRLLEKGRPGFRLVLGEPEHVQPLRKGDWYLR